MKKSVRFFRIASLASIAAFLLISLLQSISYLSMFGMPNANYFNPEAILPTVATAIAVLWAIAGGISAVFFKHATLRAPVLPIAGAISAIGYLAGGIVLWFSLDDSLARVTVLVLLASACGIAVSSFVSSISDAARALLHFLPISSCILLSVLFYFEKQLEMNAPLKVSVMAGILFVMMYHIQEIRVLLGRTTPRLFAWITFALLGVGALSALPVPIAFSAGIFNRPATLTSAPKLTAVVRTPECLAGALIVLGICIAAALRSFDFTQAPAQEPTETTEPDASPDISEDREEEA